ncbi:hypothetical protein GMOD_00007254 [Pyrenophora seminiperda CCB06]|uniref:Uncharacterized protein n=1 Tax=Pyrenophora seminiperda CCB06 TaxID=1302712 RepID=A0A3M7MCQ1_9PLEO|nr:hypothetical protein GMOD_00007254 [Pyrenophora seminiperda CCB06]
MLYLGKFGQRAPHQFVEDHSFSPATSFLNGNASVIASKVSKAGYIIPALQLRKQDLPNMHDNETPNEPKSIRRIIGGLSSTCTCARPSRCAAVPPDNSREATRAAIVTWPATVDSVAIDIEDRPGPEPLMADPTPSPIKVAPVDPKDPGGFLKRCSGVSKKTNLRCSAVIGKKAHMNTHPTFLPTCSAHRDQHSPAGWCQFKPPNGERCGRLFRWMPPTHFELCDEHQGYPGTPCYFLKQLPLELRHEIYRYLLPTEPIGSSTVTHHQETPRPDEAGPHGPRLVAVNGPPTGSLPRYLCKTPASKWAFPVRLLDLLLVSRKVHDEVKDLLFSIVTFKIDVRRDGTFMCGRRLLEPKRADGSSHVLAAEADNARNRFIKTFEWKLVKNYTVDILLENWDTVYVGGSPAWDEEVEIYDIRDYIAVVVSGILAKAQRLCKLQVRLCLSEFAWTQQKILGNAKLLFEPFERLRNVRQASLGGVFNGKPESNSMLLVSPHAPYIRGPPSSLLETCSVPSLPTDNPILVAGMPSFDAYAFEWRRKISSESCAAVTEEPAIRRMFAEFRNFYTQLSSYVPDIMHRSGKQSFLHRARVAREQEDVIAFREIQNELVHYWTAYLLNEEDRKRKMNAILGILLQSDKYPSHVWEETNTKLPHFASGNSAESPILVDFDGRATGRASISTNEASLFPQSDRDVQSYQEAELRQLHLWTQRFEQGTGRKRKRFAHHGLMGNPAYLAEYNANGNESNIQQQALRQQVNAVVVGDDSSPSTISGDDLYEVAFQNHRTAPEGEPGPSTKRRRIENARQSEMQRSQSTFGPISPSLPYSGKGKGKAYVQEID